jgi:outer membrane protein OmpA-like peptidoglycan-associated protein
MRHTVRRARAAGEPIAAKEPLMKACRIAAGVVLATALAGCVAVDSGPRAQTAVAPVAGGTVATGKPASVPGVLAASAVPAYMERQARELATGPAQELLQIARLPGHALALDIAGDLSFDAGSARIRPDAQAMYDRIAGVLMSYGHTVVHIVCHTDASGSDPYNQDLSQRRAAALAAYLGSRGLPGVRVRAQGRGESEAVADNNSAAGRKRNRRVEILVRPVIEGREAQAWTLPTRLVAGNAAQSGSARY